MHSHTTENSKQKTSTGTVGNVNMVKVVEEDVLKPHIWQQEKSTVIHIVSTV